MKTPILLICISSLLLHQSFISGSSLSKEMDPEELIRRIYDEVTSKEGESIDWEVIRNLFVDEAVVILRTGPQTTQQFTADAYIQDFKDFYEHPAVKANGFEEKILRMKSMIYKDMACITTVYSAHIPGSKNLPQQGVDFWLLRKKEGEWKIFGISNEVVPQGQELPDGPEWDF